MPFFLELVSYDANIDDNKSREYVKVKAHKVNDMTKEFSKPRYSVDVLKVEVPVIMNFVEGYGDGEQVYTKEEAKRLFKEQDEATNGVPYIYLSAGVPAKVFQDTHWYLRMKQVQHSTVFFAVVQHGVTVSNLLPRKAKKKLSNGAIPLESKILKV